MFIDVSKKSSGGSPKNLSELHRPYPNAESAPTATDQTPITATDLPRLVLKKSQTAATSASVIEMALVSAAKRTHRDGARECREENEREEE